MRLHSGSPKSPAETFFTIRDIAELMKISTRTVARWIECGDLKAVRVGAVVRVSEKALKDFLGSHGT